MKVRNTDYQICNGHVCQIYQFKDRRKKLPKQLSREEDDRKYNKIMLYLYTLLIISVFTLLSMKLIDLYFWIERGDGTEVEYVEENIIDEEVTFYSTSASQKDALAQPPVTIHQMEQREIEPVSLDVVIGENEISIDNTVLTRMETPDHYYGKIDFWSFQPFMDYRKITSKGSGAYAVCNSENAYTDENGFRRYQIEDGQFNVDGNDDFIVAMGTYYKSRGTTGSRYLIVTENGMFTVITGDEKADKDTDAYNMFTRHGENNSAAIIEWIVDDRSLPRDILQSGNVMKSAPPIISGQILYVYKIDENVGQ